MLLHKSLVLIDHLSLTSYPATYSTLLKPLTTVIPLLFFNITLVSVLILNLFIKNTEVFTSKNTLFKGSKRSQQVKAFDAKPTDRSSVPRPHLVEGCMIFLSRLLLLKCLQGFHCKEMISNSKETEKVKLQLV